MQNFSYPALSVLWRELLHLGPLFALIFPNPDDLVFPDDPVISLDPMERLLPPNQMPDPESEEWTRFTHYAPLVREVRQFWLKKTDIYLFHVLALMNEKRTILPSLRGLCWKCPNDVLVVGHPSLTLLASPALRSLEIDTTNNQYKIALNYDLPFGPSAHRLTKSIAKSFPSLQSLVIIITPAPLEGVSKAIKRLTSLKRLSHLHLRWANCGLSPHQLSTLTSGLPLLSHLDICIAGFSNPPSEQPHCILASSLRQLTCHGGWADMADLPRLLVCPALEELSLSMAFLCPTASSEVLCQCVRAVSASRFAPRLRLLTLKAGHYRFTRSHPAQKRYSIADFLQPLAALGHLENLSFALHFPRRTRQEAPISPCSNTDLRAVAEALPHASHISLRIGDQNLATDSCTVAALLDFATLCPKLQQLSLKGMSILLLPQPRAAWKRESRRRGILKELHVSLAQCVPKDRSESDLRYLAEFLNTVFPKLSVGRSTLPSDVKDTLRIVREERRGKSRATTLPATSGTNHIAE